MAPTISLYNHTRARFASGANAVGDTYKVKLLTAATFNATHTTLAATGGTEVANGNGYTTGGVTVACTVAKDTATDRVTLTFAAGSWTSSTITAAAAVIYKSRGGASSADELVFCNDFGGNVVTNNTTLSVAASTITVQN